eukprot:683673-Pyramimonas_sp.AAC.1
MTGSQGSANDGGGPQDKRGNGTSSLKRLTSPLLTTFSSFSPTASRDMRDGVALRMVSPASVTNVSARPITYGIPPRPSTEASPGAADA